MYTLNVKQLAEDFPHVDNLRICEDSGGADTAFLVGAGRCGSSWFLVIGARGECSAYECAIETAADEGLKGLASYDPEDIGLTAEDIEASSVSGCDPDGYSCTGNAAWYESDEWHTLARATFVDFGK